MENLPSVVYNSIQVLMYGKKKLIQKINGRYMPFFVINLLLLEHNPIHISTKEKGHSATMHSNFPATTQRPMLETKPPLFPHSNADWFEVEDCHSSTSGRYSFITTLGDETDI